MKETDVGSLLTKDILLQRQWFKEMCSMIGVMCLHRELIDSSKQYNGYGELEAFYKEPKILGCIFEDHPDQKTLKKLGWVSELQADESIIHVCYDENIQKGSLIIIPGAIDKSQGRVFRVNMMSTIMIYPASISCSIAPVYINTSPKSDTQDFKKSNFNLLTEEEGY